MVLGGGNSIRFYIYECKVKWSWGNGPHLVSETVKTRHKCRFLGHAINVSTVQLAHPAVNIRSRKNKILYDLKELKKKDALKKKKKKQANYSFEKKPEKKKKKKAILCQYFIP